MDASKSRASPPAGLLASLRKRSLAWLLPFAVLLAGPLTAQAAQVVFVSTNEVDTIRTNAVAAFSAQAAAAGLSFLDGGGVLSTAGAAPQLPITADTQLIVVMSIYDPINADRMAELNSVLLNSSHLEVVAFIDGCDICDPTNLTRFITEVNVIRPAAWGAISLDANVNSQYTAYLNPYSPYKGSFTASLPTMAGYYYTPIKNVPLEYALYTQNQLPVAPPPVSMSPTDETVGLFIPKAASNKGAGACLFLTSDTSMFDSIPGIIPPAQYGPIAASFIAAATDAHGACAQPKIPLNQDPSGSQAVPTLNETTLTLLALMLLAGAAAGLRLRQRRP